MKFDCIRWFWLTTFGTKDISLGIHICWAGRLDVHILWVMISIGIVPIYRDRHNKKFAVSNSYHKTNKLPIRAGVP